MSDKEKVNGNNIQKQSNEKSSKEKQKEIDKELEVLRRWFDAQGGCE